MVKRPPVIPTVRVVHVCPPIVVHASVSDFRTVVQELTGVKNTGILSMKGSCSCCHHDHLEEFMVSDGTTALMRSSFMKESTEEEYGTYTLATDYDHQNINHYPYWNYIAESGKNDKNGTLPESFHDCTIECNHDKNDEEVWPSNEEVCFHEGLSNEEVCTATEAVSVISNSTDNWTTASSYDNCMSNYTREEEEIADSHTSAQLSAVASYPKLTTSKSMASRRSERRRSKKAKLTHIATQDVEPHMEHPPLFSDMQRLSPNEENMGFISPYSFLSPSDNYSDYMHAEFHNLLQNFEESSTAQLFPFFVQ